MKSWRSSKNLSPSTPKTVLMVTPTTRLVASPRQHHSRPATLKRGVLVEGRKQSRKMTHGWEVVACEIRQHSLFANLCSAKRFACCWTKSARSPSLCFLFVFLAVVRDASSNRTAAPTLPARIAWW